MKPITLDRPDRLLMGTMEQYGGNFIRRLSRCELEADSGLHFTKALCELYSAADEDRAAAIRAEFPDLLATFSMSESDRRQHLREALPADFARYAPENWVREAA